LLFSKEIEIPEDRSKANYYSERVKISKGTVKKVFVLIPIPSAYAVGVSIWYATSQVWPTSRVEWIIGGMVDIGFEADKVIDDVPLEFEIRCYNEDTENKHTVWVGFNILRPVVTGRMAQLTEWLGRG